MLRIKSSRKYKRYFSIRARYDLECILDKVNDYPTFKNRASEKNRFSHRMIISFYPVNSRTLGLFISVYSGRDYYNVCYPDKIFNTKAGLVFEINKYRLRGTQYMNML